MKSLVKASKQSLSLICILALLAASFAHVFAQQPASQTKRPLTHQDYDSWRSIQAPQISRDGKFIAYAFMQEDGDGEIVVRNLATGIDSRSARGYHPPVPPPDDPGANIAEFQATQARLVRPVFTADSRFAVFTIEPAKADVAKAKKEKKKPEEMPKNGLGIMDIATGQVTRVKRVMNFQVPEDGSGYIAYLFEPRPEPKKSDDRATTAGESAASPTASPSVSSPTPGSPAGQSGWREAVREGSQGTSRASRKKEYGSDLVLRNMTSGTERTFSDVLDYTLSKDAKTLVFAVSSRKEETNGVYAVMPQTEGAPVSLLADKGKYQKLTWDEDQTELAFISDRDDADARQPKFKIYLWERGSGVMEGGRSSPSNRGPQARGPQRRSADGVEEGSPLGVVDREGADRNHTARNVTSATVIVSTSSPGFRKDFVVSEKATLGFSLDGTHLFLGGAPPAPPEKNTDEDVPADEKVLVDLWHWKDDYIQPIQRVRAEQDRNKSYRAVFLTKEKRFVQLADESMETILPSSDGRFAVGTDNRAYRITNDYDPGLTDYYVVNTAESTR